MTGAQIRATADDANSVARALGRSFSAGAVAHTARLYFKEEHSEFSAIVSRRRRRLLGTFVRFLWQFKRELPYIGLATIVSSALGALSSSRLHYQGLMLQAGYEAVVGPRTRARPSTQPAQSAFAICQALLWMELVHAIAEVLRDQLELLGKERLAMQVKQSLFETVLKQDTAYFDVHGSAHVRSLFHAASDRVCVDCSALRVCSSSRS